MPCALVRKGDYAISQKVCKRIEHGFGWIMFIGGLRKLPMVGITAVREWATWTFAAYNPIRPGGIGE